MKRILSNKAVQLFLLLLVAAALSIFFNIVMTKEYSNFVCTDAVITDWRMSKDVHHILYFKYSVDGVEYNGQDSFSGNYPENEIGDTVTVWYDPDNAASAMISGKKPDAGLWPYAPFILAFPVAVYIMTGAEKRKSKKIG